MATDKVKKHEAGKGDSPRPRLISNQDYDLKWELAFGNPTAKRKKEILKKLKIDFDDHK